MSSILGWIFSLGAFLAFGAMVFHSVSFHKTSNTLFIFGGGTGLSFLMEYTLSIGMALYSYQKLPVTILKIPLAIPCGWVITFYGLMHLSHDLLGTRNGSKIIVTILTGLVSVLFGLGIEVLARTTEFWIFHFESKTFLGIPYIVPLAWGLTVMNFSGSIFVFDKYPKSGVMILPVVHLLNLAIAKFLLLLI